MRYALMKSSRKLWILFPRRVKFKTNCPWLCFKLDNYEESISFIYFAELASVFINFIFFYMCRSWFILPSEKCVDGFKPSIIRISEILMMQFSGVMTSWHKLAVSCCEKFSFSILFCSRRIWEMSLTNTILQRLPSISAYFISIYTTFLSLGKGLDYEFSSSGR